MSLVIEENTKQITRAAQELLDRVPPEVTVVAAAKGRTLAEVEAAIKAGITHIGHNYVQQGQPMIEALGDKATWHMIGHLQRNKAKKAVKIFDIIETVDSMRLAKEIERRCARTGKVMPVLVEVNSGRETTKTGVVPENVEGFVAYLAKMKFIKVQGLMTMGPRFGDPEDARPFFRSTRQTFKHLSKCKLPNIQMRYLSMGMSNSYMVAIEEGANIVRIGTKIFGPRED
jgi:pyridoxal phosphate enzyme (YggS family)